MRLIRFIQDVKAEAKKVVWPTRKETVTTTVMVLLMSVLMMVFFSVIDLGLFHVMRMILG